MDKSSKRVLKLKECQIQCATKAHKILKHATTRRLSLGQCIGRLLEQWPALQVFINEEAETYLKQSSKKSYGSKGQGYMSKSTSNQSKESSQWKSSSSDKGSSQSKSISSKSKESSQP